MPRHDVDVRAVAWTGFAIGVTILVVVGAVFLLLRLWDVSAGADRVRLPYAIVVDGPTLQSAPQPDLRAERAAKARILTTGAWVDGAHGIARIPIATAMRVLASQSGASAAAGAAAMDAASAASTAASAPTVRPTSESGTAQ